MAYAQAIVAQLIAHDALPKDSEVLAISKDGDALSLDMNEAFLAGLRASGSTGEFLYMGSLVNTFLDNFNCTTVRVTVAVLHRPHGVRQAAAGVHVLSRPRIP